MNLFVTIIFAICYGIAQYTHSAERDVFEQWTFQLLLIICATMIAPLAAMVQTRWVANSLMLARSSWQQQNAILTRLSRTHSIVWAATGLLIFTWLDWPSLVAQNWRLAEVPVLYELTLLSPLVLSLIGSWCAFFDIQQRYGSAKNRWCLHWRKRWAFVSVRIRLHLASVLVPLVLILTAMRHGHLLQNLTVPQIVLAVATAGLWISAVMPLLLLTIWQTRPIADGQLLNSLRDVCRTSGVAVTRIRVWKTDNQIANAAVTGLLPGFRIVLLTDALVKYFTAEEVAAIVRHEAGHVKLLHLPLKIFFVMLPMVALILDQTHPIGIHRWIESALIGGGLLHYHVVIISQCVVAIIFVAYLFFVLRWLNHQLEHEADLFAALELGHRDATNANEHARTALEKLAAIAPHHLNHATFLHPSIASRIQLLESAATNRSIGRDFQRSFRRRNVMILIPWIALLIIASIAYLR